jgi:hypothetical protein
MKVSPRFSFLLGLFALVVFAVTPFLHSQSMMLRRNHSNFGGIAINRGDFNRDGILDIVTANNSGTASVSVYLGRADGTFVRPIDTNTGLPAIDLALGDFNNDGKLDVAIANTTGHSIQILLGNGNGTFQPAETFQTDSLAVSITASDFNNDGKMDLAVGVAQGGSTLVNEVEVLQGDGAGHFSLATKLTLGFPPVVSSNSLVTKVRVGDFNNDGKVDLAVLQQTALSVWYGNGNFTFDQVLVAVDFQNNDMTVGDLDQDGFSDILFSFFDGGTSGSASTGGVFCFFGNAGRGGLSSQIEIQPGSFGSPREMVAADVNGDGINDIVALDDDATAADGVYVWMGNADGSFVQTPVKFIYTTNRNEVALVAGDFNRDGKIDFAATLISNSTMEVLLNATPRAACQKNLVDPSMTVCRPQEATFSNSPLHIVAKGNSSNTVTDINVYVDNVLKGQFAASSIDKFFTLPNGSHFVVVKGFDSTGASFRSDRHVTMFTGAAGQTCAVSPSLSVHMCLPAQNAILKSPVQVFGNAYSPRPITAIQVYIDNHLVFNDTTATEVNKLFTVGLGTHFIVVKAFDANGNEISDARTIHVQ